MRKTIARVALSLATRIFPKRKVLAAGIVAALLPVIFVFIPGTQEEFLSIAEWVFDTVTIDRVSPKDRSLPLQ